MDEYSGQRSHVIRPPFYVPVEAFATGRWGDRLAFRVLVLALVAVAAAAVVAVSAAHFGHGEHEDEVRERVAILDVSKNRYFRSR